LRGGKGEIIEGGGLGETTHPLGFIDTRFNEIGDGLAYDSKTTQGEVAGEEKRR